MTDYDKMLVDLLNDKIRQWERKCSEQRKEINNMQIRKEEITLFLPIVTMIMYVGNFRKYIKKKLRKPIT